MSTKSAIVVLTRGYANITQYHFLIKRNLAIAKHIGIMHETDILIFHEGNITQTHQQYISSFTPVLRNMPLNKKRVIFLCILQRRHLV